MVKPAFNALSLLPARVTVERRDDGTIILRSPVALPVPARATGLWLQKWAKRTPNAIFLAERDGKASWRQITYAETLCRVRALAQALLDRNLGPNQPVMFLSDNSLDQGLLTMAGHHVGVPVVPVSPAYSLLSRDFAKLRQIVDLTSPGLVHAEHGDSLGPALAAVDFGGAEIVLTRPSSRYTTSFNALATTRPTDEVDDAFCRIRPETIAKILFTSGSTGTPKGVINTQRMLTANQEQIAVTWPFLEERPPVIVDWLPWSHTFGGNHDLNMILRNGGSLYIDSGKPLPGRLETSIHNLRAVAPTLYFNVPRGFELLVPYLEDDSNLRDHFFANLDVIFYAGASLPQSVWDRLEALSIAARGERVRMLSAWGATETAPMATRCHYDIERAGVIGLPPPGTDIKLIENRDKLEIRVRGPNVTPGYLKRDDLTNAAFDEEGFYISGDAVRFADNNDPTKGLIFDGRVAEDFKLTTGTWVRAGNLRLAAIAAAAPVVQDCVITGHDRDFVGLLAFPNLGACRAICTDLPVDAADAQILADMRVRDALTRGLRLHNTNNSASSTRIRRVILMEQPAAIDKGEITDKGYINQRAVLSERADRVYQLYDGSDPDVIVID